MHLPSVSMARPPAAVILLPVALLGAHALAGGATAGVQWWHVLLAALGMLGAYVVMDPPRQRWQDLPVEPDESVDHDVIVVGRLHIRASVQGARACVCLLSVCRLALVRCAHSAGCRLSHTAISLFRALAPAARPSQALGAPDVRSQHLWSKAARVCSSSSTGLRQLPVCVRGLPACVCD